MSSRDRYTLVIPTYNRPDNLQRLLGYLAGHSVDFTIRVLDSSTPTNRLANRGIFENLPLQVDYCEFPETTHPFDKFREGILGVTTPFCGLCADDDILLVDGLRQSIEFLAGHPDFSIAHGYYFQFALKPSELTATIITYYTPDNADDDPLVRLHTLMRHYQALTYGTYRTEVLNLVFDRVRAVGSILARELLSSALAAVHGKVARLPVIFHGRNLGPSNSYTHWHPLEWLIRDPTSLFAEYGRYRDILLKEALKTGGSRHSEAEARKLIDLIHAQYLILHAPDETFDHIISETLGRSTVEDIFGSPPITHGLLRAAARYTAMGHDGAAATVGAGPGSSAGAPSSSGLAPGASVATAGGHPSGRAIDRLAQWVVRREQQNPRVVDLLRQAKRALVRPPPVAVAPLAPAAQAAPAPPEAVTIRTDHRRYVFAPAFLSPPTEYHIRVDTSRVDDLVAQLDHYR